MNWFWGVGWLIIVCPLNFRLADSKETWLAIRFALLHQEYAAVYTIVLLEAAKEGPLVLDHGSYHHIQGRVIVQRSHKAVSLALHIFHHQ